MQSAILGQSEANGWKLMVMVQDNVQAAHQSSEFGEAGVNRPQSASY
jgi:hypothetical protein